VPDPVGGSLPVKAGPGSDLDPNSPKMQTAQKACQSLAPGGGDDGGTVSAAQQAQALKFSACMRSHGVPNFPDPGFTGGGVQLHVTGIDRNSPQMIAAQKACQSLQPGGISSGQSGKGAAGGDPGRRQRLGHFKHHETATRAPRESVRRPPTVRVRQARPTALAAGCARRSWSESPNRRSSARSVRDGDATAGC
jgi:hypothetical protein